jgi:hypothetical protein
MPKKNRRIRERKPRKASSVHKIALTNAMEEFGLDDEDVEFLARKILGELLRMDVVKIYPHKYHLEDYCIYAAIRVLERPVHFQDILKKRKSEFKLKTIQRIQDDVLTKMGLEMKPFPTLKAGFRKVENLDISDDIKRTFLLRCKRFFKMVTVRSPYPYMAYIFYLTLLENKISVTIAGSAKIFTVKPDSLHRGLRDMIEDKLKIKVQRDV